ncbi:neuraminidase-like domain-containing protein [Streptomyces sp. HD]|uniref:neuraminidase-like domain-containing protein n=1 Tax=Streptomyces sp. HD TaxID=3020892 RepID=UPI0023310697|nr:neuraminidase-like domain-containing protein [Streptomyces sp. HD]MDC0769105.1 neuraminidase-like domain-containing protein [Streptomyces sp. HD]
MADAIRLNSRGDHVRRLHEDLVRLGIAVPRSEIDEAVFGVGTAAAVRQVQVSAGIVASAVVDAETRAAIDDELLLLAYPTPRVEGRLLTERGAPAADVAVEMFRRTPGGSVRQIAEAVSDSNGFYRMEYPPLDGADAVGASLELRLVGPPRRRKIPLSAPKFVGARHEVLNLVVPAALAPAPESEFVRLSADVNRVIGGFGPLTRVVTDGGNGDPPMDGSDPLAAAARATGWDARILALGGVAAHLAEASGLEHAAAYALVRYGLPTSPDDLAVAGADAVRTALTRARNDGVVDLSDDALRSATDTFDSFTTRKRLDRRPTGGLSTYGEFLDAAELDGAARPGEPRPKRDAFDRVVAEHAGDPARLWAAAKKAGIDDPQIRRLQTQGKLAALTGHNLPLSKLIAREVLRDGDDPSTAGLRALVHADLHKPERWRSRLDELAGGDPADSGFDARLRALVPPAFRGERMSGKDAADAYAQDLARQVRVSFPTTVVGRMVGAREIPLGPGGDSVADHVAAVIARAESRGFSFSSTPLGPYLRTHGAELVDGLDERTATTTLAEFERLQRLFQISPSNEALAVLAKLRIPSAHAIHAYGKREFIARYGHEFRPGEVEVVLRWVDQVAATAYTFFGAAQAPGQPSLYGISPSAARRDEVTQALKRKYPTVEDLIGEQDFCACEHCRSVLSPAAYLVDLLHFLDVQRAGVRPLDALLKRRPDLEHLPLSCENTNTTLPLIDLANEIMEYRMAHGALDAGAARDTGPAGTADLLAEPQYVEPLAYSKLAADRYPLTAPFDLWLEMVRGYLGRADTDLAGLLDTLRRTDELLAPDTLPAIEPPYRRASVFFEQLGLSPSDVAVLTDDGEHAAWYRLYGYADARSARPALRSAKTLARRLGVSYVELVALVRTWFVNPHLDTLAGLRTIGVEPFDVLRYKEAPGVAPFTPTERDAFEARLAAATQRYHRDDFDAAVWVEDAWAKGRFAQVLVLGDSDPGCSFEHTRLRLIGTPEPPPDQQATDTTLDAAFLRLNLLVRLWRRLGKPLDSLDVSLRTLLPGGRGSLLPGAGQSLPAGFGEALRTALIYLAHTGEIADRLGVAANRQIDLLTLWEPMPTAGRDATYARLFLTPRTGSPHPVFDHPTGDYLAESTKTSLASQRPAVEAALGMTAADIDAVLQSVGRAPDAALLTLETVSLLYRHALLARGLRLPVREVIALRELTGIDPFHALYDKPAAGATPRRTLPLPGGAKGAGVDYPRVGTLAFLDTVDALRAVSMTPADLGYVLRHSVDPLGPYRSDETAILRLAAEIADALRSLAAEHAAPEDAASLTDDMVARELGLVLPAELAAQVSAMWQRQVSYTATKRAVPRAEQIDPRPFQGFPELTISYAPDTGSTPGTGTQQVAYRGVPVPERIARITAAGAGAGTLLGELLAQIVQQKEQALLPLGRLIHPADVGPLFQPPPDPDSADPAVRAQALQAYETARRAYFAGTIMPRILADARRRLVVTALSRALAPQAAGVAPALVEGLLTDPVLLAEVSGGTRRPLADVFAEVAQGGLSVSALDSAGGGVAVPANAGQDATTAGIAGAARVVLDGYLEVPQSGAYVLALSVAGAGDLGEVRLGPSADPVLQAVGAPAPAAPGQVAVDLKSGVPYRFTLTATGKRVGGALSELSGPVSVQVSADTLPLGPLGRLTLRPAVRLQAFVRAHTRLTKSLMLLQRLALTERELRHIRRHPDDFDAFDLAALPTSPVGAAVAAGSFPALGRLFGYAGLRSEMAGGTDELIDVFELAHRTVPHTVATSAAQAEELALDDLCARVAALTRRERSTVETVRSALRLGVGVTPVDGGFRIGAPGVGSGMLSFTDERGVRRLWDALMLVERLGIGAAAAIGAATPAPDAATAHSLRDAVRARYDLDAWRSVARAVNDPLRGRRRDALVAHLLHTLGLERVEELYEVLLLDPATEPVVQTTRIRQAIASVQLFVQRSTLNLEQDAGVPPAAIDTEQWEWKKRYRVWEANRKIFLFPENWLVPELRDDQTHLFTALIGALLQGDVTDRLAEDAFATYVRGLTAISRLEIVSVWGEQYPDAPERGVLHVIGRDHSAPRAYYYRRRSRSEWTPWEPVGAQIDGDHVGAVFYRGRLHLFWITPVEKGKPSNTTTSLAKQAQQEPATQPLTTVDVQLHWTELVAGQWTPRASSDPLTITGPSSLRLAPEQLVLYVTKAGDDSSVTINLVGAMPGVPWARVKFVSRNGRPEVVSGHTLFKADPSFQGAVSSYGAGLVPNFDPSWFAQMGIKAASSQIFKQPSPYVLTSQQNPLQVKLPTLPDSSTLPLSPDVLLSYLLKPFFCGNERESLFGLPTLTQRSFVEYQGSFGVPKALGIDPVAQARTIRVEAALPTQNLTLTTGTRVAAVTDPIDASAVFSLSRSPDWTAEADGVVTIGKVAVGADGVRPTPLPRSPRGLPGR